MQPDFITVVSGLPRSGTSLMMQMLQAGGLPILADESRPPDASNPRGYLEYEPVKRLRTDRSWLPLAHGRAVKVIHLLLKQLPTNGRQPYRVVLMQRPLAEVLASQATMLARAGKVSADPRLLTQAYTVQLADLDRWLDAQTHITTLRLKHHEVLRAPRQAAEAVSAFLTLPLDTAAMAAAVDPALHRQRGLAPRGAD